MSSFGFMSKYRTGYYLGVRSFLLRERRSVANRIAHINAEILRIGEVNIAYATIEKDDGAILATEKRLRFLVTPNSTLEKLVRAYIAQGGNPLDISMFLAPDTNKVIEKSNGDTVVQESQPYGGVAYPLTQPYHTTNDGPNDQTNSVETQKQQEAGPAETFGEYPGGYLNVIKYPPRRLSGRKDPDEESTTFAAEMDGIRKWANAEIRYKLHDLEARIIKQCDLREQLKNEIDIVLTQAWGGLLPGLDKWSEETYVKDRRVPEMLVDIDKRLFNFSSPDQNIPSGNKLITSSVRTGLQSWFYTDDSTEDLLDLMA